MSMLEIRNDTAHSMGESYLFIYLYAYISIYLEKAKHEVNLGSVCITIFRSNWIALVHDVSRTEDKGTCLYAYVYLYICVYMLTL